MSLSETINRAEGSYGVTEIYRYNTGTNQSYVDTFTAAISDATENDFLTLDTTWKIQGSPVYNNLATIEASIGSFSSLSKLGAMGFATGNLIRHAANISRDSGAAMIEIKNSYLSGYNSSDITGFFDYTVGFEKDMVLPKETWRIDGEFVCKGPLNYRHDRLNDFKAAYGNDWINYLSGLITSSPVYTTYHDANVVNANHYTLDIREDTGLAKFNATMTSIEGACNTGVANPKYTVEVSPQKWSFDLIPSANIEGHYVIQDPQITTQGRITINVTSDAQYPVLAAPIVSGFSASLESIYVSEGTLVSENMTTGLLDVSYNREWLGLDDISSGMLSTKVVGSTVANYTRQAGFKFGY
jgi:hypothetical protein